jgi:hypothetical protein
MFSRLEKLRNIVPKTCWQSVQPATRGWFSQDYFSTHTPDWVKKTHALRGKATTIRVTKGMYDCARAIADNQQLSRGNHKYILTDLSHFSAAICKATKAAEFPQQSADCAFFEYFLDP